MNLKEKLIKGLEVCMDEESNGLDCTDCPYNERQYVKRDGDDLVVDFSGENCLNQIKTDVLELIKAYDFALSQYKEELERLKMCRAECKIDCLLEHYNKVKDELDAMKKAQEPVRSKLVTKNLPHRCACGACGKYLPFVGAKYCPYCGRAVKWE